MLARFMHDLQVLAVAIERKHLPIGRIDFLGESAVSPQCRQREDVLLVFGLLLRKLRLCLLELSAVILSPRDITEYIKQENTWPDWRELDAIFYQGDSLVIDCIKIEALSIGKNRDVVRVSRVEG